MESDISIVCLKCYHPRHAEYDFSAINDGSRFKLSINCEKKPGTMKKGKVEERSRYEGALMDFRPDEGM